MNMNTDDWDSSHWDTLYNLAAFNMSEEPAIAYRVRIKFYDGYLGEEGVVVEMVSGWDDDDDDDDETNCFWSLDRMPFDDALEFYSEENSPEDWYIVEPA